MKNVFKTATLGLAAGLLTFSAVGANAQTMDSTMNSSGAMMNNSPSMAPMMVTGTVVRYYIDRAGYVSAMDVQTADGVKMVSFMPSMAQKLTGMYPVGSQATVSVTSSMMGNMTSYNLAGVGSDMPAPNMMMPGSVSELDVLRAQPYVLIGSKPMLYSGKLTGYVVDPKMGDVLAIILDENTVVRVPAQNRLPQASMAPEGVANLVKGANVLVSGTEEAPRYGVMSPYGRRIAATGITIGGRTLGPFGFGKVMAKKNSTLFGFNIPLGGGLDEIKANEMGYATYNMNASDGSMMAPAPTM